MKVQEEQMPDTMIIQQALELIDFCDTFVTTNQFEDLNIISNKIFNKKPGYVKRLMCIRLNVPSCILNDNTLANPRS